MDKLLLALRDNLQITWDDEYTDRTLCRHITNAKVFLNDLCETTFTFEEGTKQYELLLERCRYAWNNAVDEFEPNFRRDLQRLILNTAVMKRKESEVLAKSASEGDVE